MAYYNEFFEEILPLLRGIPHGTFFSTDIKERRLEFQARSQAELTKLRHRLPVWQWSKDFVPSVGWWSYEGQWCGWIVIIYGCKEAPRTCKAITEKRMVKVQVPVAFEEREEEREIILGWDCGGGVEDGGLAQAAADGAQNGGE